MLIENLRNKIQSFNFNCINVKNGHSFLDLINSFKKLKNNKPSVIIINTIKGKGIKNLRIIQFGMQDK